MTILDEPVKINTKKIEAEEDHYSHLSFRLSEEFISHYVDREVNWGFSCGGGNSLAEITFLTKYSRLKPDGTKEQWYECCRRVIEGSYSILKNHCLLNRTPWNHVKAQRAAEDAYERLFTFKWTPPGRGLWVMGTKLVHESGTSSALQNCAFISTESLGVRNPTHPFVRLMEMSLLGVGVGFDTKGAGKLTIHKPEPGDHVYQIEDSREGWVHSLDLLLRSYFLPKQESISFDYSLIRPAGSPLKTFGGRASGPEPLKRLHNDIVNLFADRSGTEITSTDIVDLENLIGKCVVAGGVRRSAEVAFGEPDDKEFLNLKNPEINPVRMGKNGWGFMSNNSIYAKEGDDYTSLVENISINGEPGLFYLDIARQYGRIADGVNNKDWRVKGSNPCLEQVLESEEACCLVETFPTHCDDLEDFKKTIKAAYLYGKSVTLLPTHWPETNEVMQRNRRIGCSVSGMAQFVETRGWSDLRTWLDEGYKEIVRRDTQYSEWLGIRESIKKSSVKPSGTVSLVAGVTPGVHYPVANQDYIRRQRFANHDPLVKAFKKAGYHVEADIMDPDNTVVVSFPVHGPQVRSEREVSVWEKVSLAALLQRWWADNSVSATFTFRPDEADQIGPILKSFDGQLKALSFLPLSDSGGAYEQMPYETIDPIEFEKLFNSIKRLDTKLLYSNGKEAEGERFCENDVCLIG